MSYDPIEIFNESPDDDAISLKIISYDGRPVTLRVVKKSTIEEIKFRALAELNLSVSNERVGHDLNYKLLKPSESMRELNESLSIEKNNLSDCGKRVEIFNL